MNLEQMAIKTRLRSSWQAIDLGLSLAKSWWLPLYLLWVIPAATTLLALNIAIPSHPGIAIAIVWWLKPFWERLPLYYASRALFNDTPTIKQSIKQMANVYKKDCIPWLLWRRFSFVRSFVMPVTLLEGQRGHSRSKRIQILQNDHSSAPFWLTIVLLKLEQVFPLAVATLIYLFIPEWEQVDFTWYWDYYTQNIWSQWLGVWLALLSMSLMAPLYVMGGFMAYINRRIALEGWDIEIRFRSMANRLKPSNITLGILMLALMVPSLHSESAFAEQEEAELPARNFQQNQAREEILNVLSGPEFVQTKAVTSWRLKKNEDEDAPPEWLKILVRWLLGQDFDDDKQEEESEWDLSSIAGVLKVLLIGIIFLLVLYLIYRLALNSEYLQLKINQKKHKKFDKPEVIFGLEVTPESLPENIGEQALALINRGLIRDALSLLYRASLSHFIHTVELPLFKAQTELECSKTVSNTNKNAEQNRYFSSLTLMWLQTAYAHRQPDISEAKQACETWSHVFRVTPEEVAA